MKKYISIISIAFLVGCGQTIIHPFEGNKTITGAGGFQKRVISGDSLFTPLFSRPLGGGVLFYSSGLPVGANCTLLGFAEDTELSRLTRNIIKMGGNVATQSAVSFSIAFNENRNSVLHVSNSAGNTRVHHLGLGVTELHRGYNIFRCE